MNFFLLLFNILFLFNMITIFDEEFKEMLSRFLNDTKLDELWTSSRAQRP